MSQNLAMSTVREVSSYPVAPTTVVSPGLPFFSSEGTLKHRIATFLSGDFEALSFWGECVHARDELATCSQMMQEREQRERASRTALEKDNALLKWRCEVLSASLETTEKELAVARRTLDETRSEFKQLQDQLSVHTPDELVDLQTMSTLLQMRKSSPKGLGPSVPTDVRSLGSESSPVGSTDTASAVAVAPSSSLLSFPPSVDHTTIEGWSLSDFISIKPEDLDKWDLFWAGYSMGFSRSREQIYLRRHCKRIAGLLKVVADMRDSMQICKAPEGLTTNSGYSVYATREIPANSFLLVGSGVITLYSDDVDKNYIFHMMGIEDEWWVLDTKTASNECRFLGHSDTPNLCYQIAVAEKVPYPVVLFKTFRTIAAGELLTINYNGDDPSSRKGRKRKRT